MPTISRRWRVETQSRVLIRKPLIRLLFVTKPPGGVNIVLSNGAVRFVKETISITTWQNLAYIADGNPVGNF